MRKSKRTLSVFLIMCLLCSVFTQIAMADEHTDAENYDYDYDLAMERGYLTAEDDLPDGIVLSEGEVFIPAAVPNPGHADAYAKMAEMPMQMGMIEGGSYSTNDFSSPSDEAEWNRHTWDYVGYSINRMALRLTWDVLLIAGVETLVGEIVGELLDDDFIIDNPFEVPLQLIEIWGNQSTVQSYGKKMVWSAYTPCSGYAYCHFHLLQVFDKHPDESGAIFLYEQTHVARGIDYMPGTISLE